MRIVAKYYKKNFPLTRLRELCETTREGSSLRGVSNGAESIGFRSLGVKLSFEKLKTEASAPFIVFWEQKHFIVVYKFKRNLVYVSDPGRSGLTTYTKEEFISHWIGHQADENTSEGIALLLEPSPRLNEQDQINPEENGGISFVLKYLFSYKKFIAQLLIGLAVISLIQLAFPFLTQSIVDVGIRQQNIEFIYIILLSQVFLFIGRASVELIRDWILLHLSTRINISLISDFFIKLMKLPIGFFDTKMTGDIMQRINDHKRIEVLLTSGSLNVMFSMLNIFIFSAVLAWYSWTIFLVFLGGSILYVIWISFFLNRRRKLDYTKFNEVSKEQSKIIELINGMQDIKLHNAEKQKRWSWEYLQARLFRVNIRSLSLEQTQTTGGNLINEFKNILITILAARLTIEGSITLGMMLSVSYILGQINAPILQLVNFLRSYQDALISIERLSEVHNQSEEEQGRGQSDHTVDTSQDIVLENVSFRYKGSNHYVLSGLKTKIRGKKVTAIVGASGSGKTTLLKMLLKFYQPTEGQLKLGSMNLSNIGQHKWREMCGVVMQEGYIFNDTIANNIAIGESSINYDKLIQSAYLSRIREFVENLPLAYNTKIGMEGAGLSTGQKQRILIARAIYKNPDFLFFDEATSSLDANNEREIMNNLYEYFHQKTVVIIAHRLSTVRHADHIIVMNNGSIIEQGNHTFLIEKRGAYFELVKNQLDLERITPILN